MRTRLTRRMKLVAQRILFHLPEVAILQEVSTRELPYLTKHLGKRYHLSKLIAHRRGFWREELRPGTKYLPNGQLVLFLKKAFRKSPRVVAVPLSEDGNRGAYVPDLRLLGVHLDDSSKGKRNRELYAAIRQEPLVIAGDFNALPEEHLHKILVKKGWHSAGEDGTSYPFEPAGLIDYIYLREGTFRSYFVDDFLIDHTNDRSNDEETLDKYGSDHYPVIADLNFP